VKTGIEIFIFAGGDFGFRAFSPAHGPSATWRERIPRLWLLRNRRMRCHCNQRHYCFENSAGDLVISIQTGE
jgi:hypothetical protein